MILPALVGIALGISIVLIMIVAGLFRENGATAMLVAAVAAFYPVFAVQAEASLLVIALHIAVFAAFVASAIWGFHKGLRPLAILLMAHGGFDAVTLYAGHPGPVWWPAFCAGLDIAAGGAILVYLSKRTSA